MSVCRLVDGGLSDWSEWSTCTKSCGTGTTTRSKTCTNPTPQHRGKDCTGLGDTKEEKDCNPTQCAGKIAYWIIRLHGGEAGLKVAIFGVTYSLNGPYRIKRQMKLIGIIA